MREWVEAKLRDDYLFAERVPRVRLEEHGSDEAVLGALRVDPPDRYSHLADERRYDALFEEGTTFGFGWAFAKPDPDTWLFSRVLPGSPLARAGVVRGERLLAIDGLSLPDFVALPTEERERRLGLPAEPVSLRLSVASMSGARREVTVRSARFALRTVEAVEVSERGGARVGYLRFSSFLQTSVTELGAAFETLAAADVDELLLDLRHNGGGRVDVAAALAGAVGGQLVAGETFARFRHNERYAAFDTELDFAGTFATLDLGRVLVLTSPGTCSASELVINALEPFIDVVTIGQATCGKPFGTSPERRCGRVLNALEIGFENAAGVGGYTDGLMPDCAVVDDPRTPLGRPGDPLVDAALGVLDTGHCPPPAATGTFARRRQGGHAGGAFGADPSSPLGRAPLPDDAVVERTR